MHVTINSREVEQAIGNLKRLAASAPHAMRQTVERALMRVEAEAVKRAPIATGTLRRSSHSHAEVSGNQVRGRISFGGMAAAYAEVQHEREDFAHTPAEYQRKYGHPLDRTHYTRRTLRGRISKRGKLIMTSHAKRRRRKKAITGYRGGQAHYLHGSPTSAWNDAARRRLHSDVTEALRKRLEAGVSGRGPNDVV